MTVPAGAKNNAQGYADIPWTRMFGRSDQGGNTLGDDLHQETADTLKLLTLRLGNSKRASRFLELRQKNLAATAEREFPEWSGAGNIMFVGEPSKVFKLSGPTSLTPIEKIAIEENATSEKMSVAASGHSNTLGIAPESSTFARADRESNIDFAKRSLLADQVNSVGDWFRLIMSDVNMNTLTSFARDLQNGRPDGKWFYPTLKYHLKTAISLIDEILDKNKEFGKTKRWLRAQKKELTKEIKKIDSIIDKLNKAQEENIQVDTQQATQDIINKGTQYEQQQISDTNRDRGGGSEIRDLTPLKGSPTIRDATGPDPNLVAVAEQYANSIGITLRRQSEYAVIDEQRSKRIADAYEAMRHDPQNPQVKEAYENLIIQTMAQYRALEAAGYKFWLFDDKTDPYDSKPWVAMRDLRANKSMGVYSTVSGFGTSDFDPATNPLLADTGLQWPSGSPNGPLVRVLANDLFRAVHDAFGHGLEGAGFRAQGEENAWQAHVRLFTGTAIHALTSETRGQNSWLNFGPFGKENQTASVADTKFADQKTGLMPEWTWTEGRVGDATYSRKKVIMGERTPEDGSFLEPEDTSIFEQSAGRRTWPQQMLDELNTREDLKKVNKQISDVRESMSKSERRLIRAAYKDIDIARRMSPEHQFVLDEVKKQMDEIYLGWFTNFINKNVTNKLISNKNSIEYIRSLEKLIDHHIRFLAASIVNLKLINGDNLKRFSAVIIDKLTQQTEKARDYLGRYHPEADSIEVAIPIQETGLGAIFVYSHDTTLTQFIEVTLHEIGHLYSKHLSVEDQLNWYVEYSNTQNIQTVFNIMYQGYSFSSAAEFFANAFQITNALQTAAALTESKTSPLGKFNSEEISIHNAILRYVRHIAVVASNSINFDQDFIDLTISPDFRIIHVMAELINKLNSVYTKAEKDGYVELYRQKTDETSPYAIYVKAHFINSVILQPFSKVIVSPEVGESLHEKGIIRDFPSSYGDRRLSAQGTLFTSRKAWLEQLQSTLHRTGHKYAGLGWGLGVLPDTNAAALTSTRTKNIGLDSINILKHLIGMLQKNPTNPETITEVYNEILSLPVKERDMVINTITYFNSDANNYRLPEPERKNSTLLLMSLLLGDSTEELLQASVISKSPEEFIKNYLVIKDIKNRYLTHQLVRALQYGKNSNSEVLGVLLDTAIQTLLSKISSGDTLKNRIELLKSMEVTKEVDIVKAILLRMVGRNILGSAGSGNFTVYIKTPQPKDRFGEYPFFFIQSTMIFIDDSIISTLQNLYGLTIIQNSQQVSASTVLSDNSLSSVQKQEIINQARETTIETMSDEELKQSIVLAIINNSKKISKDEDQPIARFIFSSPILTVMKNKTFYKSLKQKRF